jgi:hypothetical protein
MNTKEMLEVQEEPIKVEDDGSEENVENSTDNRNGMNRFYSNGTLIKSIMFIPDYMIKTKKIREELLSISETDSNGNIKAYNYPIGMNKIELKEDNCTEELWTFLQNQYDYRSFDEEMIIKPTTIRIWV